MFYTVKKLAKLAGVSIRTLHHYDKLGLLKPASYGANGYRYYQEEQLLMLQQILFFRELGFELKDIQRLLSDSDFNKIDMLQSHREVLTQTISRMKELIRTIDNTINYLRGQSMLRADEFYKGFVSERQKIYEEYFLKHHMVTQQELIQAREKLKSWTREDWIKLQTISDELHQLLDSAIKNRFEGTSIYVQGLIKRHYEMTQLFLPLNKESYIGLGKLYCENPHLKQHFDSVNPQLAKYLADSMAYFAEHSLTHSLAEENLANLRLRVR